MKRWVAVSLVAGALLLAATGAWGAELRGG